MNICNFCPYNKIFFQEKKKIFFNIVGITLSPFGIITELCQHGDLHQHIHNPKIDVSWKFRIRVAMDIAQGIQYLQGKNNETEKKNKR